MKKLSIKQRVYPSFLNYNGDVFGGWIVSQMDSACGVAVEEIVTTRAVTASISKIEFLQPVQNGNIISVYTDIIKIGRTSITINVDVVVIDHMTNEEKVVTDAEFVFVCIDDGGKPIAVKDVLKDPISEDIKRMINES